MKRRRSRVVGNQAVLQPGATTAAIWLASLLMALIATRFITLGAEVVVRPIFPFDATMHWATKARVWFEAARIVPFVENSQWLAVGGEGVYTDHHPDYPITVPLLQVWISSALGVWNESLINLPWLVCFLSLGLAFYGQARIVGCGCELSLIFTYMLLSMPLVNTHVALAGYADLFLGTAYCLAMMAFHNWSVGRQPWQGLLALLLALSCPLIKNEGFYWMLTFVPALAVVLMPTKRAFLSVAGLAAVLILVVAFFPRDLAVAGHSLDRLNLHYRPGALESIIESFFVHDNWHLLAYFLTALLALSCWKRRSALIRCAGISLAIGSALALFLFLFTFTAYAGGAIKFTAVGRIALQLVPAMTFLALVITYELSRGQDQGNEITRNAT
jgi:hypothetical protein